MDLWRVLLILHLPYSMLHTIIDLEPDLSNTILVIGHLADSMFYFWRSVDLLDYLTHRHQWWYFEKGYISSSNELSYHTLHEVCFVSSFFKFIDDIGFIDRKVANHDVNESMHEIGHSLTKDSVRIWVYAHDGHCRVYHSDLTFKPII